MCSVIILIAIVLSGCTAEPEEEPLGIMITYPHNNDIISGTITITADAWGGAGVLWVSFRLQFSGGYSNQYYVDPSAPYEYIGFNTTQYDDGTDVTITATACDSFHNYQQDSVHVEINNSQGWLLTHIISGG